MYICPSPSLYPSTLPYLSLHLHSAIFSPSYPFPPLSQLCSISLILISVCKSSLNVFSSRPLFFITARPVRSSSPVQTAVRQNSGPQSSAPLAPEFSSTWLGPSRFWQSRCPTQPMFPCHWCSPGLLCNGSDTPEAARQKTRAGPDSQSGPCTLNWWVRGAGTWLDWP